MIISLSNQKGGVGKTTTAIMLVRWLTDAGHQALYVNADNQKRPTAWAKELGLPFLEVQNDDDILDVVPKLAEDYEAVVIDGPGALKTITVYLIQISDLVLVPCKPGQLDLDATAAIVKQIRHARKMRQGVPRAAFFLSLAKKNSVLLAEARQALSSLDDIPILQTVIYDRVCIADCAGQNSTVWQMGRSKPVVSAQSDYQQLFSEVLT